jgi:uncharacterized LabA/DUF88 family protein
MSIGMFIDGAYIWHVFQERINYASLRTYIEKELGDEMDDAYYFNADDDPPKAQKLHNALAYPPPNGPGLRVKIYWLQKKLLFWPKHMGGGPVMHPSIPEMQYEQKSQKAVDVGLTFHMVRSYHKRHWNKLVLAAGDSDFHEPVQSLVEGENVELYLVGSVNTISDQLRPYAKKIFEIDKEPLHSDLRM